MQTDKLIYSGWGLYLVSLVMPWSARPFSGWLPGGFWQLIDLPPFLYALMMKQSGLKEIAATLAIMAGLIMWMSPLILYFLKRGTRGIYAYLPVVALIFAFLASGIKIYYYAATFSPLAFLYVLGNMVWVVSFALLCSGFIRQIAYIKNNVLPA